MTENPPKLHVTQHAILSNENGVWTGRYGGEDWLVTADSKEAVLALLVETMGQVMSEPEWNGRIVELAQRVMAGETVEGFEAECIGENSFDGRIITSMETQFSQD